MTSAFTRPDMQRLLSLVDTIHDFQSGNDRGKLTGDQDKHRKLLQKKVLQIVRKETRNKEFGSDETKKTDFKGLVSLPLISIDLATLVHTEFEDKELPENIVEFIETHGIITNEPDERGASSMTEFLDLNEETLKYSLCTSHVPF